MNQQTGNAVSSLEPDRIDDLTERDLCSYFVPTTSGAMGQMSVVLFGSKQFLSAQIHPGHVFPAKADFKRNPPARLSPMPAAPGRAPAGHCREQRLDSAAQFGLGEGMHADETVVAFVL